MHRCLGFLVRERAAIPPRLHLEPGAAKRLRYPQVTDRSALPLRPERHVPTSIATLRITIAQALS